MIKIHERCGCGAEITVKGPGASTVVDKLRREHQHQPARFAAGGIVQGPRRQPRPNSGASARDARRRVEGQVDGL